VINLFYFIKPGLHVSKQTVIHGNITTDTNSYIAGTIHGDIIANATLVIEKNGVIIGNVRAKNVVVRGKIKGNIHSDGKVDVKKNGEIEGHVYAIEVNVNKQSSLKGTIRKLQAEGSDQDGSIEDLDSEDMTSIKDDAAVNDEDRPQSWF